jgi:hypothetical protein
VNKSWRTILGFAVAGLCVAGLLFAYFETNPPIGSPFAKPIGVAAIVLCPGALLFANVDVDMKPHTKAFNEMWSIIAVANCFVYAVIGAAYVRVKKKLAESAP